MKKARYTNEMLANYFSGGLVLTDAFKKPLTGFFQLFLKLSISCLKQDN